MDADTVRRRIDAGAFDEALALLRDAAPENPTTSWLLAEIHERRGDMLWFHDRPGSGDAYRAAMDALLPRQAAGGAPPADAAVRQEAWSRIAEKVLHGTGPDGCRRRGATGRPHPHGDPPRQPPRAAFASPAARARSPEPVRAEDGSSEDGSSEDARDDEAPVTAAPAAPPATTARPIAAPERPGDRGHLRVGRSYRIAKSFRDLDGITWEVGTVVVYHGSEYFPYDDGLMLLTDCGSIRLCGLMADNAAVMAQLDVHFVAI